VTKKASRRNGAGDRAPANESTAEQTPSERFSDFLKRLLAVPKSEIDERAREYEKQKQKRKNSS
jgi:hypothetical protein